MPRSAIMITRSRKLSLKLVYQLTHKTMICRSKCRPLNRSSIGANRCISSSSPATLAFAPEPLHGYRSTREGAPAEHSRSLRRTSDVGHLPEWDCHKGNAKGYDGPHDTLRHIAARQP